MFRLGDRVVLNYDTIAEYAGRQCKLIEFLVQGYKDASWKVVFDDGDVKLAYESQMIPAETVMQRIKRKLSNGN